MWGGGSALNAMAEQPPWSPAVFASWALGPKLAGLGWLWLQLSLGGATLHRWMRQEGASERGATLGSVGAWMGLWMARHVIDGHLPWGGLAWCVVLAWLLAQSARHSLPKMASLLGLGSLALLSSSHLQAPVYGLPVVLGGLLVGLRRHPQPARLLAAAALAPLPAIALHVGLWRELLDVLPSTERAAYTASQAARWSPGPGPKLLGILLPFASFGRHAEGNLLALLPALLATRRPPTRGVLLGAAALLALALIPALGPLRQLERVLWGLPLLAGFHLALNAERVPLWAERLSLGLSVGGCVLLSALRVISALPVPELPPARSGVHGVAQPRGDLDYAQAYDSVLGRVQAGEVVLNPPGHAPLPLLPTQGPELVLTPGFSVSGDDAVLRIQGPWEEGVQVTLQLRGAPLTLAGCARQLAGSPLTLVGTGVCDEVTLRQPAPRPGSRR